MTTKEKRKIAQEFKDGLTMLVIAVSRDIPTLWVENAVRWILIQQDKKRKVKK